MGESLVERMRRQALESQKATIKHEEEKTSATAKVCPGCGAGRAEQHGVKECRYCGYVFITAHI